MMQGTPHSDLTSHTRCSWALSSIGMTTYHDREWGVPVHEERRFFEFLILEGAQAGLSWSTILNKRDSYLVAFENFDPRRVASFTQDEVGRLIADSGIVRNRLKISSAITNARAFLETAGEYGSFDRYIWQFTGGAPIQNQRRKLSDIPAETAESRSMSADLKRRGFRFVGSTICYAFMQATGMVNDHTTDCFRHAELGGIE